MERTRTLGMENAKKVLRAMQQDPKNFGFVKISLEELASIEAPYTPSKMGSRRNIYNFLAGNWMILIIVNSSYVEVTLLNPYDIIALANAGFAMTTDLS